MYLSRPRRGARKICRRNLEYLFSPYSLARGERRVLITDYLSLVVCCLLLLLLSRRRSLLPLSSFPSTEGKKERMSDAEEGGGYYKLNFDDLRAGEITR